MFVIFKFLVFQENNLPASYMNEVAQYIIENIPEARQATNKKMSQSQPTQKVLVDGKARYQILIMLKRKNFEL